MRLQFAVMKTKIAAPTIRRARLGDAATIAEFNARLAEESEGILLDVNLLRRGVRAVLTDKTHRRGFYLVAERGGAMVGQLMITYEWSDWRNGWFWWIQSVYVRPEHRRTGVIRALFDHIQKTARKNNVCGFRLYVDKSNIAGIKTYDALGMERAHYDFYQIELRAPKRK